MRSGRGPSRIRTGDGGFAIRCTPIVMAIQIITSAIRRNQLPTSCSPRLKPTPAWPVSSTLGRRCLSPSDGPWWHWSKAPITRTHADAWGILARSSGRSAQAQRNSRGPAAPWPACLCNFLDRQKSRSRCQAGLLEAAGMKPWSCRAQPEAIADRFPGIQNWKRKGTAVRQVARIWRQFSQMHYRLTLREAMFLVRGDTATGLPFDAKTFPKSRCVTIARPMVTDLNASMRLSPHAGYRSGCPPNLPFPRLPQEGQTFCRSG